MDRDRGPNLKPDEVRRLVAKLDTAQDDAWRDMATRLAWRPAWAIRSRRGAVAALREMFRRRAERD